MPPLRLESQDGGLGKVRHLAIADLWIQDRLKKKAFALEKVLGSEKPSDMLTKHVDKTTRIKQMKTLRMRCEGGRADTAPSIYH